MSATHDAMLTGFLVGLAVGIFFLILSRRSYRATLLLKTGPRATPEKLPDGKFYYLVAESEYGELRSRSIVDQIGYITPKAAARLQGRALPDGNHAHLWHRINRPNSATVAVFLVRPVRHNTS